MKKDWVRALLVDAIERRFPVSLMRKKLELPPLLCVPLAMGEHLALVAPYVDFLPDGYEVVRLRDISRIAEDGRTSFHGRIMASEGVLADLSFPPALPLSDFPQLLTYLMELGEPVIVTGKNQVYLLGTIGKVGKSKLGVRYIDGEGSVDDHLTRIAYEDIQSICFGTRYLRLLLQYANPVGEPLPDADLEEDKE